MKDKASTYFSKHHKLNHKMSFQLTVVTALLFFESVAYSFVSPKPFHLATTHSSRLSACQAIPVSTLGPSFLIGTEIDTITENVPAGFEDAFTDEIVLFDDTIKLLVIGLAVVIVLAVGAKFFLNQMDAAIEKVLVDFENTMKTRYQSRWVSIEAKLDGLDEPERSQKLFLIMEQLQESEPDFMAKVNRNMGP